MAIFKIENLSFSYPQAEKQALKDISISIAEGEFVLLCGVTGCGKSTLLRHLKTVLTPYGKREGNVLFRNSPLFKIEQREQAKKIGFVMQHPDDQIVTDKVWHELAFGMESLGAEQSKMRLRSAEIASFFGIHNWFYKNVAELSGGQKQLLSLASIMAMDPDVIILDEPTSQLDPIASTEFLNTLKRISNELGITVILSEHRLEEALPMSDRVIVMENGSVIANDNPSLIHQILKPAENTILSAMPTPMRVFSEIKAGGDCPMNVRDGRKMLSEMNISPTVTEQNTPKKMRTDKPLIEVNNCYFRYEKDGADILKGLSIKAYSGEILIIVGGNGTGKSTALSVMSGVNRPYRGKILMSNKDIHQANQPAISLGVAVLPQDPRSLFVKSNVRDDLLDVLDERKFSYDEKQNQLEKVVTLMGIEHLLSAHPYDLSGGEQQRAAIAKVLLLEPKVLLLDEPTKGLDAFFKKKFGDLLRTLSDGGMAILITSHDIEFCAEYADRCGLFFDGSIVSENSPREFFCENSFYTTAANRMARHIFPTAITAEEVISLCKKNVK